QRAGVLPWRGVARRGSGGAYRARDTYNGATVGGWQAVLYIGVINWHHLLRGGPVVMHAGLGVVQAAVRRDRDGLAAVAAVALPRPGDPARVVLRPVAGDLQAGARVLRAPGQVHDRLDVGVAGRDARPCASAAVRLAPARPLVAH